MNWKPTDLDICRSYKPLRMDDITEMEEIGGDGSGGRALHSSQKTSPYLSSRNVSMFNAENNKYEGVRGYAFSHGDKCTIPTSNPTISYGENNDNNQQHKHNKFKRSASKIFKKIKNTIHPHHSDKTIAEQEN